MLIRIIVIYEAKDRRGEMREMRRKNEVEPKIKTLITSLFKILSMKIYLP